MPASPAFRMDARLLALSSQEQDLVQDAERQDETGRLAAHAEASCQRVQKGLATADFERKRTLLELLIDRIVVTNGAVEIRYVVPIGPKREQAPSSRLRTDYRGRYLAMEARHR
jgi:site-specific DNA recombinase